jgi:hypothetical protein
MLLRKDDGWRQATLKQAQAMPDVTLPNRCRVAVGAPLAGKSRANGSAFAPRACARRKPFCLVLDLYSDLGERLGVLPAVVSAEKQLPGTGEHNAYVRLGAAPVAYVSGGQRLAWR